MRTLTLDTGALVGVERNDRRVVGILQRALERGASFAVPAGVVAQVWRDGSRQVRLARLLAAKSVHVFALDDARARAAGQLCGVRRTRDVVDASVALCAREHGGAVLTSDREDLEHLDPSLHVIDV